MDDGETQPVVSPQRLSAASNVVICLTNGRAVMHMAGEWTAGAIEQAEDQAYSMLIRTLVVEMHRLEQRLEELRRIGVRRLDALQKPPRVTQGPGGAA